MHQGWSQTYFGWTLTQTQFNPVPDRLLDLSYKPQDGTTTHISRVTGGQSAFRHSTARHDSSSSWLLAVNSHQSSSLNPSSITRFELDWLELTEVFEVSFVRTEHVGYPQSHKVGFQIHLGVSCKPTERNTNTALTNILSLTFEEPLLRVLLGDHQVDFPQAHQLGPVLHCGSADVGGDAGQVGFLLKGNNYQHADAVSFVGQLDDPVFHALRCAGDAWRRKGGRGLILKERRAFHFWFNINPVRNILNISGQSTQRVRKLSSLLDSKSTTNLSERIQRQFLTVISTHVGRTLSWELFSSSQTCL